MTVSINRWLESETRSETSYPTQTNPNQIRPPSMGSFFWGNLEITDHLFLDEGQEIPRF